MGKLCKVKKCWKKNSLVMMSRKASGICIVHVIWLYAWMTLIDTLVGIWGSWRIWCKSEEFGRKNVISVAWIRNYVK